MKIKKIFQTAQFLTVILLNSTAFAYSPEEKDLTCKKPHFTDFNLTEYKAPKNIETPPESEFIIKFSAWTDPSTIKLTAKKQPLPFTVESNSSFHKIKAKLPASLNGSFVRIDVSAKALLGCADKTGWLIKVADK